MKKTILFLLALFILVACEDNEKSVFDLKSPPTVNVKVDGTLYETIVGSHCWGDRCSDIESPEKILSRKTAIKVGPNEKIKLVAKGIKEEATATYNYIPDGSSKVYEAKDMPVDNLTIRAPAQLGVYYIITTVKWERETIEGYYENAISDYIFAIEVIN